MQRLILEKPSKPWQAFHERLFLPFGSAAEKLRAVDPERCGQFWNFRIRNPADLAFDPGNDVAADIPAGNGELCCELTLGDPPLLAEFSHDRPHNVSR
jgi:hypothetical protein